MNKEFEVNLLSEKGIDAAKFIAVNFNNLLEILKGECNEGREFSICRTKLEEACFYAKKAMAQVPDNQSMDNDKK